MQQLVMGQAMTFLAHGYGRTVRTLVAGCTVYHAVIRFCCRKIHAFLGVAVLAERRRNPTGKHNLLRAVWRMAAYTVGAVLGGSVRLMTIQATGTEAMTSMAVSAEKLRMPTGRCLHLLSHLGMTGKACLASWFYRVAQREQRLVRIGMTLQAVIDPEVRLPLMTLDTGGYCICPFRRMLRMAFDAADLGGVFASLSGNCLALKPVTLGTILLLQVSLGQFRRKRAGVDQHEEK
jgi:hypothetical protein